MSKKPPFLPQSVWEVVINKQRLEALAAVWSINASGDPDFNRLCRMAAETFRAPFAAITLVGVEDQRFVATYGLDLSHSAVGSSFSVYTLAERCEFLVIKDTILDPRFANNPMVIEAPHIRFYAGASVRVDDQRVGTLCVLSPEPIQSLDQARLRQLTDLAATVGSFFALKDEARVRAHTAAALMQEEWRHALTLEAGRVGSWVWDVRSGEVVVNDIFRTMHLLQPGSAVNIRDILAAVTHADRNSLKNALRSSAAGDQDYICQYRIAANHRWLMAQGRVFQRDANGRPLIIMGVNLDITETRQAAEQTRELLRELNHRVKNTLAMIQSLARQTLHRNHDPETFIKAFSGRLQTLSDAHSLLADHDWSGIWLKALIGLQVEAAIPDIDQFSTSGKDMRLPPDHALGLGIILHELVSNALKYGAFSVPEGHVSLEWHEAHSPHRFILTWRETKGPPVQPPQTRGLGIKLIERSLLKVLDSSVELKFPPEGVCATITFPLKDI